MNDESLGNTFINTTYKKVCAPISDDLLDEQQVLCLWPAYIDVRCKFHRKTKNNGRVSECICKRKFTRICLLWS